MKAALEAEATYRLKPGASIDPVLKLVWPKHQVIRCGDFAAEIAGVRLTRSVHFYGAAGAHRKRRVKCRIEGGSLLATSDVKIFTADGKYEKKGDRARGESAAYRLIADLSIFAVLVKERLSLSYKIFRGFSPTVKSTIDVGVDRLVFLNPFELDQHSPVTWHLEVESKERGGEYAFLRASGLEAALDDHLEPLEDEDAKWSLAAAYYPRGQTLEFATPSALRAFVTDSLGLLDAKELAPTRGD